eukprot:gene10511-4334_t
MLGTNDLKPEDSDAAGIADKIIALHAVAHEAGVKTLCIGIPESRITALPPLNETVGVMRSIVNGRLKDWATYTDFPLAYGEGNAKDGWEADGVHLNLEGYSCVAERIAPLVKTLVAEGEDSTE